MTDPMIALRLDAEDRYLLDACCSKEKLSKSDILRRALRAYAASLGVKPESTARKLGRLSVELGATKKKKR